MSNRTILTRQERFMGGRGGAILAFTMGILFVLLVGWSLLELTGLVEERSHHIPMPLRVVVVLFTPAMISSHRRCRKRVDALSNKQVSK